MEVERSQEEGSRDRQELRMQELFGVRIALGLPREPPGGGDSPSSRAPAAGAVLGPPAIPSRCSGGLRPLKSPESAWVANFVVDNEAQAERSLMHRYQVLAVQPPFCSCRFLCSIPPNDPQFLISSRSLAVAPCSFLQWLAAILFLSSIP